MPRLAQQFACLRKQRYDVPAKLNAWCTHTLFGQFLTSMPGVGVRTAARPLTEVAHKAFASAAHLAAYAGLAPVIRRSGSPRRTPIQARQQGARESAIPLGL